MRVGITGVDGLIGWHLRAYFHTHRDMEVRGATRTTFDDVGALSEFVTGLDVIVHFAAMNRGDDAELEKVNMRLAAALIDACERTGATPHIIFSSSTHIERDTAYGRSKRECADRFRQWTTRHGVPFTNLILPHVFGEFGRPFHNSVVSTFCHQLARSEKPRIEVNGQLDLLHAQQVAARIHQAILNAEDGDVRLNGELLTVSELLARLERFASLYAGHLVPDLRLPIDLRLFNTYRSYLFPSFYPVSLELHTDNRGQLFEVVRSLNGGQMFLSTTKPGITRGNHFHTRKIERFLVADGEATIRIRRIFSDDVHEFRVRGSEPQYIDMPTFCTHNITNVGRSDLVTVFWAHEVFDPNDTDTFPESVLPQ